MTVFNVSTQSTYRQILATYERTYVSNFVQSWKSYNVSAFDKFYLYHKKFQNFLCLQLQWNISYF